MSEPSDDRIEVPYDPREIPYLTKVGKDYFFRMESGSIIMRPAESFYLLVPASVVKELKRMKLDLKELKANNNLNPVCAITKDTESRKIHLEFSFFEVSDL